MNDARPIGVFDSGVGGLTVVRELVRRMPAEDIVYFGDTARVPYGIKSGRTVVQFAIENASFLLRFDPKAIVVACNTASSVAIPKLMEVVKLPVFDVVRPGARAAVKASGSGVIAVIGTETTIASGSYHRAIREILPDADVIGKACPLFVPMVEEGRDGSDPLVRAVAREYLGDVTGSGADTLVMGCTHYPLLCEAIAEVVGPTVVIVDSARETAGAVQEGLAAGDMLRTGNDGRIDFYASDNPKRFAEIGSNILARPVTDVRLVAPEDFFRQTGGCGK